MPTSRQLEPVCNAYPAQSGKLTVRVISYSNPSTISAGVGITGVATVVYKDVPPNSEVSWVFNDIPNGSYNVTVQTPEGTETIPFTFGCNLVCTLEIDSVEVTDDFNNQSVGEIEIAASGASGSAQYSLNYTVWQSSNIFSGLSAGTYTVYVKDSQNCVATQYNVVVGNGACGLVIDSFEKSDVTTNNGTDGTASIVATTTASNVQYSLNGGPYASGGNYTGLAPGFYTITARDSANCTVTQSFTIENADPEAPEDCFNPSLVISELNPFKFVIKHCNSADDIIKLYSESEMCGKEQPCYYQPLLCSDVFTLQLYYLDEEFSTVPRLRIINAITQEVLYSIPFTSIGSGFYKLEKNVSELPNICGKRVYLEVVSYSAFHDEEYYVHAKSEGIKVSNFHECNLLIEYWNDSDYNEMRYEETGYINNLRIEGIFEEEDTPQEMEVYVKSNGERVQMSEYIYELFKLDVNFAPVYLHKIIALALSHQHVRINGREYVKEEPYSYESVKNYALRVGTVKLSSKYYQSKNLIY